MRVERVAPSPSTYLLFCLVSHRCPGSGKPYKIRIGFPSLAFSYMPFYVAQEKGFYKKYGIESEYIQMTQLDSASSRGRRQHQLFHLGVDGNFRRQSPVCRWSLFINFCDMSPWVLVTHKDINKPQDLIGKTVALSGSAPRPIIFFKRS